MKRLNVTRERVLDLINKINSTDSKTETCKVKSELCELLSAVIDAKYQIEHYTNNFIMDYPFARKICSIEDLSFYGKIRQLPKSIKCNIDAIDNCKFEFYTEWLDINLDEYFNKLQNKSIRYASNLKKQYTLSLKNVDNQIERLESCKISDLEFQIK